jgi:hypothetical protein
MASSNPVWSSAYFPSVLRATIDCFVQLVAGIHCLERLPRHLIWQSGGHDADRPLRLSSILES